MELVRYDRINLGDIDTSLITDMSSLFEKSKRKNFLGIELWDTSNVTDMSFRFTDTKKFNEPIDNLDTSNVEDMNGIFNDATSFKQSLENFKMQINFYFLV